MDTIKINKTGEVAKTIMEITSLLDEYCRMINEDLKMLKYSTHTVTMTNEMVGKKRKELQAQMDLARSDTDALRDDHNQLKICEIGIVQCHNYLRALEKCYQELERLGAIERNMKNEMEKALNTHSVFQTKIMPLLEQIEAAY